MTVLSQKDHASFSFSTLSENLKTYNKYYKDFSGLHACMDDRFFRALFCFFLDLDSASYKSLLKEHGKIFYMFYKRIVFFNFREEEVTPYIDNLVVMFAKIYQFAPEKWISMMSFIKNIHHKNDVTRDCYLFESVPNQNNPQTSIIPTSKYNEGNRVSSFFKVFFEDFEYFIQRLDKISYQTWQDVFDMFFEAFPDTHFLCLMEMTEEYFSKIDYMNSLNTMQDDENFTSSFQPE